METLGLISDTHGRFCPALVPFLNSCDAVIHAGDVTDDSLLCEIRAFARVLAVRGNNDWALSTPQTLVQTFGQLKVAAIHDLGRISSPSPAILPIIREEAPRLIVHGHTHLPSLEELNGIVFINPGSAGGRGRGEVACSAARITLERDCFRVQFIDLGGESPQILGSASDFPYRPSAQSRLQ